MDKKAILKKKKNVFSVVALNVFYFFCRRIASEFENTTSTSLVPTPTPTLLERKKCSLLKSRRVNKVHGVLLQCVRCNNAMDLVNSRFIIIIY
jgi:hypothetical protein